MKKQSNLSRLLQIAGNHKYLIYASWVLSAISEMCIRDRDAARPIALKFYKYLQCLMGAKLFCLLRFSRRKGQCL